MALHVPGEEKEPQMVARSVAFALALVIGAVGFGGGLLMGNAKVSGASSMFSDSAPEDVDFSPVWKAWRIIDERFVPAAVATSTLVSTTTDPDQRRVWGMVQGLAGSLGDPYTYFLPPVEQKQFEEDLKGSFEGVGMEIAIRDQILTVVSPLRQSPAERAGIKAGDRILKIDDTDTRGMDVTSAVNLIRGEKGTTVTLLIAREGASEPKEYKVTRDVINVPIIVTTLRPDGIFVIELTSFTANSPALFRNALRQFVESGSTKLILDLRGNPGGYLDAAVDMASWFLPAGKAVVVEDYAGNQDNVIHRSRGYDIFSNRLEMVILVDRGSASASEILALALMSYDKATLVGTPTFGKGSVQELVDITSDTSLKLTVARWVGPNGEPIPHSGIVPDVEVKVDEKDLAKEKEIQMEKAIEILNK